MRAKDFLIALPLNIFFAAGMLYLRDVKGALKLLSLSIVCNLLLWPAYFLILAGGNASNVFALVIIITVGLVGLALALLITWTSARKRKQRAVLGIKRIVLILVLMFCGFSASSYVSPRHAPIYSADTGWQFGWLEPFSQSSGSMLPSLKPGDWFWATNIGSSQSLKPGDIVVFRQPKNEAVSFVKRIVGMPGDQVEIRNGLLHINGASVDRSFYFQGTSKSGQQYIDFVETLPSGASHIIREMSDNSILDNTAVYTVPSGFYFLLGDNRDLSNDSRTSNVGFVPVENIYRRAASIYFSHDGTAIKWDISEWLAAVSWDRIGLNLP